MGVRPPPGVRSCASAAPFLAGVAQTVQTTQGRTRSRTGRFRRQRRSSPCGSGGALAEHGPSRRRVGCEAPAPGGECERCEHGSLTPSGGCPGDRSGQAAWGTPTTELGGRYMAVWRCGFVWGGFLGWRPSCIGIWHQACTDRPGRSLRAVRTHGTHGTRGTHTDASCSFRPGSSPGLATSRSPVPFGAVGPSAINVVPNVVPMPTVMVDTNVFGTDSPMATAQMRRLLDQAARGNLELVVPEIVVREAVNSWAEGIRSVEDRRRGRLRSSLTAAKGTP